MEQSFEEFEPLFDYSRVQPKDFSHFDDGELDSSPSFVPIKKRHKCDQVEKKDERKEKGKKEEVVVLDDEEDWLLPPPPTVANIRSQLEEDSTIQELRLKKQELASLAQSAEDILRSVTASTKRDISISEKSDIESGGELPSKRVDRKKIVISIQDKDGQKQFRMYTDDKFERLFKMYADKVKLKQEILVFSFDGDKVSPAATPRGLGLEDDDMIEVHIKSKIQAYLCVELHAHASIFYVWFLGCYHIFLLRASEVLEALMDSSDFTSQNSSIPPKIRMYNFMQLPGPPPPLWANPTLQEVAEATRRIRARQKEILKRRLQKFWNHQEAEMRRNKSPAVFKQNPLPIARIKRIMKTDQDVKMVSCDTPILVGKACELFILELTLRSYHNTHGQMRLSIQRSDIARAVQDAEELDFLSEIVPPEDQDEGGSLQPNLVQLRDMLKPQQFAMPAEPAVNPRYIISRLPPPLM